MRLWRPTGGGYVRDITHQPGTLGQQVSEELQGSGSMMYCPKNGNLTDRIRRLVRRRPIRRGIAQEREMRELLRG